MAAKSQQGIRTVIQTLLLLLEDAGIPRISSEAFRKAKFNQPEATTPFWSVLYHIVQISESLQHSSLTFDSTHSQTQQGIKLSVRKHLFSLGYDRVQLFCDPVNSRELVLAFAWLFNKTDFVQKLTQYHLRAANTVCIPLKTGQRFLVTLLEKEVECFRDEVEELQKMAGEDLQEIEVLLKRMVWLKGKVNCRFKSALSSQQNYLKLADKIRHYTQQPHNSEHFTVHELFLLRHPEQLTSYMQELEKHLLALQRLMEWRACEPLFWQWMESVLDLDEKERSQPKDDDQPVVAIPERRDLESRVDKLDREVSTLIEKNRPHIERINRIWCMKCKSLKREDIEKEQSKVKGAHKDMTAATDSLASVEQLRDIDLAVHVPSPKITGKQVSRRPIQPSLNSEQEKVHSDLLQALRYRIEQLQRELVAFGDKKIAAKELLTRQVESIDHALPPNVCKLES